MPAFICLSIPDAYSGPANGFTPEKFSDAFFSKYMEKFHVPGAAVVIIRPESGIFTRGYGFSDLGNKKPVDAKKTLFRLASITKLFTAAAAMKLVEDGALSLDGTAECYLGVSGREKKSGDEFLISDLLTHTTGLDKSFIAENYGVRTATKPDWEYLRGLVAKFVPPRTAARGKKFEYMNSNYEMTLLGVIIGTVSNMSYFEYIRDNIFNKLNMLDAKFFPDGEERKSLSRGYEYSGKKISEAAFSYYNNPPASGLFASAADVGLFLADNLAAYGSGECVILKKKTYLEMHSTRFDSGKPDEKMALGFKVSAVKGRRALWHTGTLRGFASMLYIFPDEKTGFFLVYNTGDPALREKFLNEFSMNFFRGR